MTETKKPNKRGRPPRKYDPLIAKKVLSMAQYGLPHEYIATILDIGCVETLNKYYATELKKGKAIAHAQVCQTLFNKAVIEKDNACLMFWAKTQLGFRETNRTEVSAEVSVNKDVDIKSLSDAELMALAKLDANQKSSDSGAGTKS